MAQSLISGAVYLAIAAIILSSVYLTIVHATDDCVNGTLGGNCNGSVGWGTYANAQWTTAEVALWGVMGLAGIIALLMAALHLAGVL